MYCIPCHGRQWWPAVVPSFYQGPPGGTGVEQQGGHCRAVANWCTPKSAHGRCAAGAVWSGPCTSVTVRRSGAAPPVVLLRPGDRPLGDAGCRPGQHGRSPSEAAQSLVAAVSWATDSARAADVIRSTTFAHWCGPPWHGGAGPRGAAALRPGRLQGPLCDSSWRWIHTQHCIVSVRNHLNHQAQSHAGRALPPPTLTSNSCHCAHNTLSDTPGVGSFNGPRSQSGGPTRASKGARAASAPQRGA